MSPLSTHEYGTDVAEIAWSPTSVHFVPGLIVATGGGVVTENERCVVGEGLNDGEGGVLDDPPEQAARRMAPVAARTSPALSLKVDKSNPSREA